MAKRWKYHNQPDWQLKSSRNLPGKLTKEFYGKVNPVYVKPKKNKGKNKGKKKGKKNNKPIFREHFIEIGIEQIIRDATDAYNWLIIQNKQDYNKYIVLHDENKNIICNEQITWRYKHSNLYTYVGNNEKCWKLIFDSLLHPIKDNIINELIDTLA